MEEMNNWALCVLSAQLESVQLASISSRWFHPWMTDHRSHGIVIDLVRHADFDSTSFGHDPQFLGPRTRSSVILALYVPVQASRSLCDVFTANSSLLLCITAGHADASLGRRSDGSEPEAKLRVGNAGCSIRNVRRRLHSKRDSHAPDIYRVRPDRA